MRLTFQEIRNRAIQFAHDWHDETSERSEAQSFWNDFFNVFGIHRRSVASFENAVRNLHGGYDRIDVIWQGVLIGEHKSLGQDLSKAASQANGYVQSLTRENRDSEVPRYIIVSDFARIVLHDLDAPNEAEGSFEFPTTDLHKHIRRFDFLNGIQSKPADPEDPINIQAVEVLGELHDALEESGYSGHQLERFLVRVLFCLFAEDTGIFEPDTFKSLVEQSRENGSDLGAQLDRLFRVLDTPEDRRAKNLPEDMAALPYVNGELFAERHDLAEFDTATREALLKATGFQWAKISPAVFGSLFQSIMAGEAGARRRRQIGAHYTSERDIMKLIRSLFLDDLRAEFERIRGRKAELARFHDKLASLKFLDPACGCGNFLVVAYRELRRLENDVIEARFGSRKEAFNLDFAVRLNVDQMHGIEIEEWPARIAEVAMWLIDHQMNLETSQRFGEMLVRLPLKKSAKIVHGNALRIDWNDVLPASECSFVMGNPPFVGKKEQNAEQKADANIIWGNQPGAGILDYVTCWYRKACQYSSVSPTIRAAFVSTNSIAQGEQVAPLWNSLWREFPVAINFAHRSFAWQSEARGRAHVHVVIVGFSLSNATKFTLFEYATPMADPVMATVRRINPYLTDAPDVLLANRKRPVCTAPLMNYGSMMIDKDRRAPDSEGLILGNGDREAILEKTPELNPFIRQLVGGDEFLNGTVRWCLWLLNAPLSLIRANAEVRRRIKSVREFRINSERPQTKALAETPFLFGEIRQPTSRYLLFPKVGSSSRRYFPIGFMEPNVIASGSALVVPNATLFHFGVLSSIMHTSWLYYVGGRMKSDPQYSGSIVYNNYPWPQSPTEKQKADVEARAQTVLDVREAFPDSSLADLYDPVSMPAKLAKAHAALDKAVDKCYRSQPFTSDRQRVEFLFGLYEELTRPALPRERPRQTRRRRM